MVTPVRLLFLDDSTRMRFIVCGLGGEAVDGRQCTIQDSFLVVCVRSLFSSGSVEIFSTGWRNKGTYVQQGAVEISFLTKDSQDVWSQ